MNKALTTLIAAICLSTMTAAAAASTIDSDTKPNNPISIEPQQNSAAQIDIIIPPHPRDLHVISQNTAIGIALDHAPPSREYAVSPYDFKGTPAYSVMFRTDNGSYEVIIAAVSGRVLDKGYLQ